MDEEVHVTLGAMADPDESTRLAIRVIPRAKHDEVGGERAGRLLVRTTAAPVDDQANVAVRRLIAEHLNVSIRRVEIVSGHHSRDKVVSISP
jgi:uncharacterized protein YggU (UPF0235/DUF167 family)